MKWADNMCIARWENGWSLSGPSLQIVICLQPHSCRGISILILAPGQAPVIAMMTVYTCDVVRRGTRKTLLRYSSTAATSRNGRHCLGVSENFICKEATLVDPAFAMNASIDLSPATISLFSGIKAAQLRFECDCPACAVHALRTGCLQTSK